MADYSKEFLSLKKKTYLSFALLAVSLLIFAGVSFAYECKYCPENFYCADGFKNACPPEKPVTEGIQKGSISDCKTCIERDGITKTPVFDPNEGKCVSCFDLDNTTEIYDNGACTTCASVDDEKPVYDSIQNTCLSCTEVRSDTPVWTGSKCTCETGYYEVTCGEGLEWNGTECVATVVALATIPTDSGSFKIMEVFTPSELGLGISKSACEAMINDSKYPDVTECYYEGDYWAGSYKYCVDKGMRLPTMQELAYVARVVYGDTSFDAYTDNYSVTVTDNDLFNLLSNNNSYVYLWSSEQLGSNNAYYRSFDQSFSDCSNYFRYYNDIRAFCLGD